MEFEEDSSIVVGTEVEKEETGTTELIQVGNCEPKAKKRRVEESDSGNVTVISSIEDSLEGSVEIQGQFVENLVGVCELGGDLMGNESDNGNLNDENVCVDGLSGSVLVSENLKETVVSEVNLSENCCFDGGLRGNGSVEELEKKEMDLNEDGLNENVLVGENLKETVVSEVNLSENCCFDGGLRGDDSVEELEKKEMDLNEDGLNENVLVGENLKETVVYEVNLSENCCFDGGLRGNGSVEEIEKKEMDLNEDVGCVEGTLLKEVGVDEDFKKIEPFSVSGETQVKGCSVFNEHEPEDSPVVRDLGTQSVVGESKTYISEVLECTPRKDCSNTESHSMVDGTDDGSGLSSRDKEGQKKKKRRVTFGNTNSTEIVLRRSSRRISSLSSSNHVTKVDESSTVNISNLVTRMDESSPVNVSNHVTRMDESFAVNVSNHVTRVDESSAVNILSHEISVVSGPEGYKEQSSLPPKVELPPSSRNVILDEIPILDVFSVYSILRSFSTILFLSPFELEAFVVALKYKFPNSLIDSIHVSILQILKLNLEFLSDEGSQSASNCLRSLNWGLLDLITWPVYMVEYLLIHGPGLKPGFELSRLKLLNGDYYKQPPTTKIEILRCLCDDLIGTEVIRLELNRRTIASDLDVDVDRTPNVEMYKKRKDPIDESSGSCLAQEIVDKTTDWNSDECCLCKMDGNLICCDGCPAAYHSRCVGIAKDLLPEGDWYCPECMIDKNNPCMKLAMSLRGAEVLATDPYGRVYFSSCGYLLVSDSCEIDSSYYYYHKDDLTIVMDVLKSSHILYNEVISAISMNWGTIVGSGPKGLLESPILNVETDVDVEGQASANGLSAMPIQVLRRNGARRGTRRTSRSIRSDSATENPFIEIAGASPFASSKGSTEFLQVVTGIQKSTENGADYSNKSSGISNEYETPENTSCNASQCSKPNGSDVKQKKNIVSADPDHTLSVLNSGADSSHWQFEPDHYVNYYRFAQVAASVAVELTCKSSDIINDDSKRSAEELITAQMKAISKKWIRVCWPNSQRLCKDAEKESCGWCFYCKNPTDSEACLFNMTDKKPSSEGSVEVGSSSKRNKNSHLTTIINYILSIEERLSGLLSGPWHNPHYRKHWRKSVLKASNVASLKNQLLSLESNLHRLALSSEWLNLVDSVVTVGSASHILTKGQTSSSKHGGSRKRAKFSHTESNSTSNASGRSGILWWRGGRVSRQVFQCKVLPHSLAFKGGRQGGCGKIATLLYPDNSEFVRRSKYIAWRAAVEMSTSIPQLACQVRELDLNLRWNDLENTQLFSQLAQESIKLMRPFKKVSVRRKCVEGTLVKYLLDFGKRKTIPEVVIQHGVMLEVSASERKKYWLDESHVPLHLLKAFEEKKVARIGNKTAPGVLREEAGKLMKKTTRKRGLSLLLSKSENYQCGQCNTDVPVREAVSCTDCKGFFHKKHFRTTKGTVTSECTYKCHKCQNKIHVKKPLKMKKKKGRPPLSQKKKISILVPVPVPGRGRGRPKGSVKKVKHISLQSKKLAGIKKQEQVQATKGTSKKVTGSQKGKRTRVYHAFWLNGLRLTRKPNDARGMHFRETKLLLPSEDSNAVCTRPICCLCPEAGYTSRLIYVECEICQDWFHGDAFGLTLENSANLLGFRCHKCRKRKPPLCPHLVGLAVSRSIYNPQLSEEKINAENDLVKEVPSDIDKSPTEKDEHRFSPNEVSLHKNHKPSELPDSNHKHNQEDKFPFSDPTVMFMECETESEKGLQSVVHQEQKADKVLDSNQIPVLGV